MNIEDIIDKKLMDSFLDFKRNYIDKNTVDELDLNDSDTMASMFEERRTSKKEYDNFIKDISDADLKNLHALYYFGRDVIGREPLTSFNDMYDYLKDTPRDEIEIHLFGVQIKMLEACWNLSLTNFNEHHVDIEIKKEKWEKQIDSYRKKDGFSYNSHVLEGSIENSTNKTFEELSNKYSKSTTDITIVKNMIDELLNLTAGNVIVDFLGYENFDHLSYIDNDDEILKLYWKYSSGANNNPFPPHNTRVDIKFEKMEFIKYSSNYAILLKGYYLDKKALKQYYCNKEKITKLHYISENKRSQFYYDINFDKRQNGSIENFDVTFLPWRYYNVIIIPKEDAPDVSGTSILLIVKNLVDIEDRMKNLKKDFDNVDEYTEDRITMYGNSYRKILENLLKFVLLASKIMFKENYSKDLLGLLLEQMHEFIRSDDSGYSTYDSEKLESITNSTFGAKI